MDLSPWGIMQISEIFSWMFQDYGFFLETSQLKWKLSMKLERMIERASMMQTSVAHLLECTSGGGLPLCLCGSTNYSLCGAHTCSHGGHHLDFRLELLEPFILLFFLLIFLLLELRDIDVFGFLVVFFRKSMYLLSRTSPIYDVRDVILNSMNEEYSLLKLRAVPLFHDKGTLGEKLWVCDSILVRSQDHVVSLVRSLGTWWFLSFFLSFFYVPMWLVI